MKQRKLKDARMHLEFSLQIYKKQHQAGRSFLHEHPFSAISWKAQVTMSLASVDGVIKTKAHMCRYGMTQQTKDGWQHVKKPTGFLTNSHFIAEELNLLCNERHEPAVFQISDKTRAAQIYPKELCMAICRGLEALKSADAIGRFSIGTVNNVNEDEINTTRKSEETLHEETEWQDAWDDVGQDAKTRIGQKRASRRDRLFQKMLVYTKVPISECVKTIGKQSIWVKLVDINKQDEDNPK